MKELEPKVTNKFGMNETIESEKEEDMDEEIVVEEEPKKKEQKN